MALEENGASSETVSIAVVGLCAARWRAVHVCLAGRLPHVLGTARTVGSQIHQSSGDHQFLADVSLCSSGHPVSFRLRLHDGLFFCTKRILIVCLSLRWIFSTGRQLY